MHKPASGEGVVCLGPLLSTGMGGVELGEFPVGSSGAESGGNPSTTEEIRQKGINKPLIVNLFGILTFVIPIFSLCWNT